MLEKILCSKGLLKNGMIYERYVLRIDTFLIRKPYSYWEAVYMNTAEVQNFDGMYSEIFDSNPSAVIIIGHDGRVIRINSAGEALLGRDLVGTKWIDVIRSRFCIKADDGHEISLVSGQRVKVTTTPLASVRGQMVQLTDLTETRALQDKMRKMEKLSDLGRMAATLAHQLRTPLSAAMLYAANLSNSTIDADCRRTFQTKLMDRLQDLEDQISDVLLFARSGDNIAEEVEITELIRGLSVDAEVAFDNAGAELTVQMDEPPLLMIANPSAIKGALLNLFNNALQANATHVHLQAVRRAGILEIRVIDNGDGIDKEKQSSIFEPFFTTKSSGTGLGLAVVKAVVTAHHGNVKVASVKGEGTCFTMEFPLQDVKAERNRRAV